MLVKNLPTKKKKERKKESAYNAGDLVLIPELVRSLKKEMATHSSILKNSIRRVWWATVHGVAKSQT